MDVLFISKQKGNTIVQCPELGPKHVIRFHRGKATTSNKVEIKRLLSDDFARRNTSLAPKQDLEAISKYLDSPERPDVFTKEYLNSIPFELWEEIIDKCAMISVKFPLVGLAKAELEGKSIDPVVEKLVEEYHGKPAPVKEPETELPISTEPKSTDHSVREAVEFLKGKSFEDVENYIAEDEERISLLKLWNDKYPEHAVDLP